MTQMVTRCPKCATAFRITSTQLESARGAVRCGSCLHIFKAQDYLVKSSTTTEAIATPQPTANTIKAEPVKSEQLEAERPAATETGLFETPASINSTEADAGPIHTSPAQPASEKIVPRGKPIIDKAKVLEDEDDVLISDDMDDDREKASTYEFDGFIDLNLHPKQTVSLFEREIRYEPPREDDDDKENSDESWAEELLDDDSEPLQQFKKAVAPMAPQRDVLFEEPEDTNRFTKEHVQTEAIGEPDNKYSGSVFSLVNEKPAEGNPAEDKEKQLFSEAFLDATRPSNTTATSTDFTEALSEQEPDIDQAEKSGSKRPIKSASRMRAFDSSRAALLLNIMPAPVELTARRMHRWYQKKLWPSLAIIMGILLLFQIAYFKFDYFSRVEPYRTAYLFICPVLGCSVPSLVDTTQILATNLIVRNHPDIASALMVDAILINNAPFAQPFPDLVLSFSTLDETPVASRTFTPKEYLGGELVGMKYIPERQPVHITLEIADPGPDAVNYTLATH